MSRKGTTITFLNSARSAAGLGTDGVPVTQALRSYLTSGIMFSQRIGMIKDPTITVRISPDLPFSTDLHRHPITSYISPYLTA